MKFIKYWERNGTRRPFPPISEACKLYGKGLDVANWYLNSELEQFDNFYESALQEVVGEE